MQRGEEMHSLVRAYNRATTPHLGSLTEEVAFGVQLLTKGKRYEKEEETAW